MITIYFQSFINYIPRDTLLHNYTKLDTQNRRLWSKRNSCSYNSPLYFCFRFKLYFLLLITFQSVEEAIRYDALIIDGWYGWSCGSCFLFGFGENRCHSCHPPLPWKRCWLVFASLVRLIRAIRSSTLYAGGARRRNWITAVLFFIIILFNTAVVILPW